MAKTNLQLKAKDATTGNSITTTLSYINPDVDSNTLKQFGQMLNGLTANTYEETNRIQTINVDTEEIPSGGNSPRNLTVTKGNQALLITFEGITQGNYSRNLKAFQTTQSNPTTESLSWDNSNNCARIDFMGGIFTIILLADEGYPAEVYSVEE